MSINLIKIRNIEIISVNYLIIFNDLEFYLPSRILFFENGKNFSLRMYI